MREFIELLNLNQVKYVIVGGYALAVHGHPRFTGDIDFFVKVSEENSEALEKVIQVFGFSSTGLTSKDFSEENQVIQLGVAPNRIDILTTLTGVLFDEAWNAKIQVELDGIAVNVISKTLLVKNKEALGRAQDIADIEKLNG